MKLCRVTIPPIYNGHVSDEFLHVKLPRREATAREDAATAPDA